MATKQFTSKTRQGRNRTNKTAAAGSDQTNPTLQSDAPLTKAALERLKEAIDAERDQLFQAYGILKCLTEVLLYADDEDSLQHADAAKVAAKLIDEAAGRLDWVALRAVMNATESKEDAAPDENEEEEREEADTRSEYWVKEPPAEYICQRGT